MTKQITCNFCGDTYSDFDVAHVCSKGSYAPKLKPKMNERIKELVDQATTYIEPTYSSGEGWIFDKQKFAELIVQDCININRQELSFTAFEQLMNRYQDHFGVER